MDNNFQSQWAIVEVFGHAKYAAFVSIATVGNTTMVQLNIPELKTEHGHYPAFTKMVNHSSIFSITPVTEEYAVAYAKRLQAQPIEGYEHQDVIRQIAEKAVNGMKLEEIKKLLQHNLIDLSNERIL